MMSEDEKKKYQQARMEYAKKRWEQMKIKEEQRKAACGFWWMIGLEIIAIVVFLFICVAN